MTEAKIDVATAKQYVAGYLLTAVKDGKLDNAEYQAKVELWQAKLVNEYLSAGMYGLDEVQTAWEDMAADMDEVYYPELSED